MGADDQATAVDRPEDRFDAAALRFRDAAMKARAACQDLAQGARGLVTPVPAPPAAPPVPPSAVQSTPAVVERPAPPSIPQDLFAPAAKAAEAEVVEHDAPAEAADAQPVEAGVEAAPREDDSPAPALDAPPPPPEPPPFPIRRPPAAALLDELGPLDLSRHALEPLDGRLRWRVPLGTGRAIEVAAGPEDADAAEARHWNEGFGDLYEPLTDLGEAAVWEPLSHTLHTHERGWAVTATVDVTFGSELAPGDLLRISDVARAALAARPEKLPPPAPHSRPGLLRRGRRG
jgi:hypothetical protein